ncbi:MAG: hypothetical protein DI555_20785 [Novosphingobium pentaromativorans]|uniref:Uncharacterized protein n=1 Tax=Novosphingobium pentaromativorans TaxID=205844 RepID=A0A2W5NE75_9SPHN|nr:MAG: hypothetical protein DI555_20785 [Novosphingobium pentaromativorans]
MDPIVKAFQLSVQEEGRRLVLTTLGWNGFNEVNTEVWARTFKDMASSVRAAIWLSTDHDRTKAFIRAIEADGLRKANAALDRELARRHRPCQGLASCQPLLAHPICHPISSILSGMIADPSCRHAFVKLAFVKLAVVSIDESIHAFKAIK